MTVPRGSQQKLPEYIGSHRFVVQPRSLAEDEPENTYDSHPFPRRTSWDHWQVNDTACGYDDFRHFSNGGRPPPCGNDHPPYGWSEEQSGSHDSPSTGASRQDAPAKVPLPPKSDSEAPPLIREGWLSKPHKECRKSSKNDEKGSAPSSTNVKSAVPSVNEKLKAVEPSGQMAQTAANPAEKPPPSAASSLSVRAANPTATPKTTPASKPAPASKSAPAAKSTPAAEMHPVVPTWADSPICISSEDESTETTEAIPKEKPKKDGSTRAAATPDTSLSRINKKTKATEASGQVAQKAAKRAEKPSPSAASSSSVQAAKPIPTPKASPASKLAPASKSAPAAKSTPAPDLAPAPKLAPVSKPDATKIIKKEPNMEKMDSVVSAPADQNHHIFISSSKHKSAEMEEAIPKKKPKKDGSNKALATSDEPAATRKHKKRTAGRDKTTPSTPDRSASPPEQDLLHKSPRGGAFSTNDIYRKDGLIGDDVVVGEIDDSLIQQVEVGDLPEEMRTSLRVTPSSGSEQASTSDDTHSFLSDDEIVVLPTPKEVGVFVALGADSDHDMGTKGKASAATKPDSGIVGQGARSGKERPAALKADDDTSRPTKVRQAKPVRQKDRQADERSKRKNGEDEVSSSSAGTEAPCVRLEDPPLSRSRTSTPQGASRPPSAPISGQQQTVAKQNTPLLGASSSAKVPSPPPVLTVPTVVREAEPEVDPGVAAASQSSATPRLKSLVDELVQLCYEEDQIRSEIDSVTLTLEEVKKKRDELLARECRVRKVRLERLQCLQGLASLQGDQPFSFTGFPTTSEVLASLAGSSNPFSYLIASPAPAAPTVTSTQQPMGVGPGSSFGQPEGATTGSVAVPVTSSTSSSKSAAARQKQAKSRDLLAARKKTKSAKSNMKGTTGCRMPMPVKRTRAPIPLETKQNIVKDHMNGERVSALVLKYRLPQPTVSRIIIASKKLAEDESLLEEVVCGQEIKAHDGTIVALKLHKHYIFSSSTDNTAKRFDLSDPSQCVVYNGSTSTVKSLEVHCPKNLPTLLYAACYDGFLRWYNADSGKLMQAVNFETPIICSALRWGKIYLGLQTGHVAVFDLKSQKLQDSLYCSDNPVNRIATTTEGAQKLVCTVTDVGSITVRDPSTGLLFRCLDGLVQPPSYIAMNKGFVYTTSTDGAIHMHKLWTGNLLKVYEGKSAPTGVSFCKNLLVCCSVDGLVRCYKTKDFSCQVVYYGAGKDNVISMDVNGPLIATGNKEGKIEVVKFDESNLQVCEVGSCNLKFAREEDLVHHLKQEHIAVGAVTCPWRQCQMSFSGPNCNKDFEKHLMDHAYP